jgi:hypothetical protein
MDNEFTETPWIASLRGAAVRPGDDFEKMTVGILEVHPAATIVTVDFVGVLSSWIGPMFDRSFANASKDLIELVFAYEKGVVLRRNFSISLVKIERDTVAELDDAKGLEPDRFRQAEDFGEEQRGPLLVTTPDDGVIELHAHVRVLLCELTVEPSAATAM